MTSVLARVRRLRRTRGLMEVPFSCGATERPTPEWTTAATRRG